MPSALEQLIAIKSAEINALALQFKQPKENVRRVAQMQPGSWAEQLAQLAALSEHADSLAAEFAGFVGKARVLAIQFREHNLDRDR